MYSIIKLNPIGKGLKSPLKASELGNIYSRITKIQDYVGTLQIPEKTN